MANTTLHFRIQAVPTVFMVLLTPVFIALGIWQLERAEQKRAIATLLEVRRKLPALPISNSTYVAEQLQYRQVIATGRLLSEKTVLIENRKHQGKTGFHVITPLLLTDGQILLVNRGWIPKLGQADHTDIPSPKGELIIQGEVNTPQPPALDLSLKITQSDVMPRWPFLTLDNYSAWSGLQILPFMILQSPEKSSSFKRQWPQPQANDAMHIGYAIQWFAFALITLLIWLRLSLHKQHAGEAK